MLALEQATRRGRRDPNEFAQFAFADPEGRPLCQAAIHRELQAFLSTHDRAMVELPRDHGKSVQTCVRLLWELGRRPHLRVKVVCASEALAAERGRYLRRAIAENERLRLVFPGLVCDTPQTDTRFSVRRPAEVVGPSVTCLGIGAALTGARADFLACDDIVDVRALHSRADRERVKSYFRENLVNLLEPDGRLWILFTPWHDDDLNAELKKNGSYAHFRRAVGDDLEPVWPEKWPRERLEQRRKEIGSTAFTRAYRLLCLPDDHRAIQRSWIKFWSGQHEYGRTIMAIDPAVSTKEPADASALVVLGRAAGGKIHCLEATPHRLSAPEMVKRIAEADRRWEPDTIVFEANGPFQGMADLMRHQADFAGKMRSAKPLAHKATRIETFSVSVENGTFLLQGNGVDPALDQRDLFDEMTIFPVGKHDDLLDAAALGTTYLIDNPEPTIRTL